MHRNVVFISAFGLPLLLAAGCDNGPTDVVPQPSNCEASQGIDLAAGESVELSGAAASLLCVEATSLGEEFVLVTSSLTESDTTQILVESQNAVSALGPPSPAPPAPLASSHLDFGAMVPAAKFDAALRERERTLVIHPGAGAALSAPAGPAAARSVPSPGDLMTLNAQTSSACEDPIPINARVEAVSQKAIVVADVDNPAGGFVPADYENFAETFDTFIAPVLEEHFGTWSDIDGNGRVIIFFTKEVNALSSEEDGSFTYGFFFSRDLFPVEDTPLFEGCGTSNEGEMVYLLVPDPSGEVGIAFSHDDVLRLAVSGIAHEAQHLVSAGEHLFGAGGPRPFEETWLNEGLSHAAEELLFYEAANLTPRLDIGIDDLDQTGLDAINGYQLFNYLRLRQFFLDPSENSPFNTDDGLATRGAAWNFLRYAADRRPGDDAAFFRSLETSPFRGFANLAAAVGGSATLLDWLGDWSVGLYADNRVPGLSQKFFDQSWDNPSLFSGADFEPPYIQTSNLALNPSVSQTLIGGGSAYLRFAVNSGQTSTIEISSGGGAPPSTLRVTLLRTR